MPQKISLFLFHTRQQKEEEERRRQFVVLECERVLQQKDTLIRLQPLGFDRNHDRYWLFNATTPGLYVEKGWVDHHTTYSTQVKGMLILFYPTPTHLRIWQCSPLLLRNPMIKMHRIRRKSR